MTDFWEQDTRFIHSLLPSNEPLHRPNSVKNQKQACESHVTLHRGVHLTQSLQKCSNAPSLISANGRTDQSIIVHPFWEKKNGKGERHPINIWQYYQNGLCETSSINAQDGSCYVTLHHLCSKNIHDVNEFSSAWWHIKSWIHVTPCNVTILSSGIAKVQKFRSPIMLIYTVCGPHLHFNHDSKGSLRHPSPTSVGPPLPFGLGPTSIRTDSEQDPPPLGPCYHV